MLHQLLPLAVNSQIGSCQIPRLKKKANKDLDGTVQELYSYGVMDSCFELYYPLVI